MLSHIEAPSEQLVNEALRISELRAQTYLSDARKESLSKQLSYICFELQKRQESLFAEVETAAPLEV